MSPAVSQVFRSTRTRLRMLKRLAVATVVVVLAMIVLAQFTDLGDRVVHNRSAGDRQA